ncbi:MAG: hypothetical protein JOZ63_19665 [Planctomycetaceae bacterium]|nr:hypothetical protein [Planctomycetaceae bacterium]
MHMFLMILVAGGIVLAVVLGALSAPAAGERREWREDDGDDRDDGFRPTEREV